MGAKILTVAQQKGGAGKTTAVIQLATTLADQGHDVALVDIDPQGSLTEWMKIREHKSRNASTLPFSFVGGWRLESELERLSHDHSFVIVDSPPHAETEIKLAIRAADLVIIPCQPSPLDVWASKSTLNLAVSESRRAMLLLNRVPPRGRNLDDTLAAIRREGYPAMVARLGNRQAFVTSLAKGLGVIENEPRSTAAAECRQLGEETLAAIE